MRRAILIPLATGAAGLAGTLVQARLDPRRAAFAYAAGFDVALTIALGALLFLFIAKTIRATWFVALGRIAGAVAATLPVFLLLFVPIALFLPTLYPWAGPSASLDPEARAWAVHARPWLNVPFFLVRSFVYLAVWSALATLFRRYDVASDRRPSEALLRRQRRVSAAGIPLMAFTLTFAAFDWIMSLNARWSSDMIGVYVFAGGLAGAMGTLAVATWLAIRARVLPSEVGAAHVHALGRLLLVSVIFWAYIAFCQFLLIWITDMDRETTFYLERTRGSWIAVSAVLGAAHFAIPFLVLLSRAFKRSPALLAFAGGWLVCAHALDVYWLVVPPASLTASLIDLCSVVGILGVTAAFGAWRFFAVATFPRNDPALAAALRYESP